MQTATMLSLSSMGYKEHLKWKSLTSIRTGGGNAAASGCCRKCAGGVEAALSYLLDLRIWVSWVDEGCRDTESHENDCRVEREESH